MNVYVSGFLWVVCAVIAGALIAYSVRRYGLDEGRRDNNDAAGQAFTIIGGLHAVVVAFVLISLFDAAVQARERANVEARSLVAATWAANSLPGSVPGQVRELAKDYARTVVRQEWPHMQQGTEIPGEGWALLDQMRTTVESAVPVVQPGNDWMVRRKVEAQADLVEVYQIRQARLNAVKDNQVGSVLWFVLAVGSLIFVLLPNLFGGTKPITHIIIVSALAAATALLCFAIYQLQNPYGGGTKTGPEPFNQAIERLG
ncbi:bestrophin-like domain [Amycolatopsis pigmentata]|uniref:DUF4239 domain-containing protein n=1 Tax=Amycolatopsis pigmentata TaxID=450801 RepID=A0ABW5G6I3_9PSEU